MGCAPCRPLLSFWTNDWKLEYYCWICYFGYICSSFKIHSKKWSLLEYGSCRLIYGYVFDASLFANTVFLLWENVDVCTRSSYKCLWNGAVYFRSAWCWPKRQFNAGYYFKNRLESRKGSQCD